MDESPAASGRSDHNSKAQTTRCTILKLLPDSEWSFSTELEIMKVVADWTVDCYVECVGFVKESEGE